MVHHSRQTLEVHSLLPVHRLLFPKWRVMMEPKFAHGAPFKTNIRGTQFIASSPFTVSKMACNDGTKICQWSNIRGTQFIASSSFTVSKMAVMMEPNLPMVHHSRQTLEVQLTEVSCYQNGVS
jgi:hypothetical protein